MLVLFFWDRELVRGGDGAVELQGFDLESGGFALGAAATPQCDVVEEGVTDGGDQE